MYAVVAIFIGTAIAFWQYDWIITVLKAPAPADTFFIYNRLTEGFSVSMRVSVIAGLIIAMPVVMYELLMFILPALTGKEKRTVLLILPWVLLMFFGGVYFGYRYLIPPALKFLLGFGVDLATPMINLGDYVSFILRLLMLIGALFELPVVTTFLARMGVVSWRWLNGKRKVVIIGAFVVAAALTPTPDIFNQTMVAGTVIILYEISIWLAWLVEKRKKKPGETLITSA